MQNTELQRCNEIIKKNNIEFIDLKSIDLSGRLHHITLPFYPGILEKLLKEGVGFDGSSYGFRKVENSDMILTPDLSTAVLDPFRVEYTLSFYSHIILTDDERSPFSQDGRLIAKKAEKLLLETTGADKSMWGPEFEFYIFSNVEYDTRICLSYYKVEHAEEFYKKASHAANPIDIYDDFKYETSTLLKLFGISAKYHHHEVGERGQQEIETYFADSLTTGD